MSVISVIVPIYKVEPYLCRCVDSILAQTFSDFELILVDDGSPDNCGAICDEYANSDRRIHVIHKENGGLSSARNAGLDIATGKYICFVDGDDSIHPELLSKVLPVMEQGAEIVSFRFQMIFPDGKVRPSLSCGIDSFQLNNLSDCQDFLIRVLLQNKFGWEACTHIFVREKIEKNHLRFEDNRKIFAEDLYFCLCYCADIRLAVSLPDCLYDYYRRDDSIMGKNNEKLNVGRMNELSKAVLCYYQRSDCFEWCIKIFPIIHYCIINNVVQRALNYREGAYREIRKEIYQELIDPDFFRLQYKMLLRRWKLLCTFYSKRKTMDIINMTCYLLGGSLLMFRLRKRIIRKLFPE